MMINHLEWPIFRHPFIEVYIQIFTTRLLLILHVLVF